MTQAALIRLDHVGSIACITLSRPAGGNALNVQLCREFREIAESCASDQSVRAVLLRADGRAFCFGGDISEFSSAGDSRSRHIAGMAEDLHAAQSALHNMAAPLIVAVQGATAGAGVGLAMMGDIVLAGMSASFTLAYAQLGLSMDGGATYVLPRLIGLRRTQELAFTNRRLSAEDALSWGMVTSICRDEDLQAEALRIADSIAHGPTAAYGAVKRLLAVSFDSDFERQTDLEARSIATLAGGRDAAEGIDAFVRKRRPVFSGTLTEAGIASRAGSAPAEPGEVAAFPAASLNSPKGRRVEP